MKRSTHYQNINYMIAHQIIVSNRMSILANLEHYKEKVEKTI